MRVHANVLVPVPVSCQQSGTEPFAEVSSEALASMLPPRLAALEILAEVADDVAWFPPMSVARAVIVTGPSPTADESQVAVYGAEALVATTAPLTRKSTREIPRDEAAFAVNVTGRSAWRPRRGW